MTRVATQPERGRERRVVPSTNEGLTAPELLLVEDEPALQAVLRRYLEILGCRVTVAKDFAAAVDAVEKGDGLFHNLVLDVHLPGGGGRRVYEYLRNARKEMTRGVIFITGGFTDATTEAFVRSTGRPVLMKPFDLRELDAAIRG